MKNSLRRRVIPTLLVLCQTFLGQLIASPDDGKHSLVIEYLKADFAGHQNISFPTSTLFLNGQFEWSQRLVLFGDLPITHRGYADDFGSLESQTIVGNPYLGVGIKIGRPLFVDIGGRFFPLSPDLYESRRTSKNRAARFGAITDFKRFEAFTDVRSFKIGSRAKLKLDFLSTGFHFAYNVMLGKGLEILSTTQWLTYGVLVSREWSSITVNVDAFGLSPVMHHDKDAASFIGIMYPGDHYFQLGVAAILKIGRYRPAVEFRLPLGKGMKEFIHYVFGMSLRVEFN